MRPESHDVSDGLSVTEVLALVVRQPGRFLVGRWNYKSAVLSACVRAALFFAANLSAGVGAALGAFSTEFWLRFLTAGFYGALTQALHRAEPARAGMAAAMVLLPITAHSLEILAHAAMGTPNLWGSILVSMLFTVGSTAFNVYAMRQGVFIVGDGAQSLVADLRRLPAVVGGFAGWVWREVACA